jgi:hypothetical protein
MATFIAKKQIKQALAQARVSDYANDQRQAYAIDERMRQLGRSERYIKGRWRPGLPNPPHCEMMQNSVFVVPVCVGYPTR